MTNSTPTGEPPPDLVAYLDGELEPRAARAMEKRLRADPKLRAQAKAIRSTWALLDFLPQPEPSPTFTTRTLDKVAVLRPSTATPSRPLSALPSQLTQPVFPVPRPRTWLIGL